MIVYNPKNDGEYVSCVFKRDFTGKRGTVNKYLSSLKLFSFNDNRSCGEVAVLMDAKAEYIWNLTKNHQVRSKYSISLLWDVLTNIIDGKYDS